MLSIKNPKAINLLILLFLIAAVPLTVFVARQRQEIRQRAQVSNEPSNLQNLQESQFLSNEILIKVKKTVKEQVKESLDTGIVSLSSIMQKNSVKDFRKVAKESNSGQKDSDAFSWYKITMEGQAKKIEGNYSQQKGSLESKAPEAQKLQDIINDLKNDPNIENIQPNYIVKALFLPNDPYYYTSGSWSQPYSDLWGLKKLQLQYAWDRTQGEGIVVAVVDTGLDYNHEDISSNVWSNQKEIPGNGIDDDGNGFIDDVRGWDFTNCRITDPNNYNCLEPKSPGNNPIDNDGHGTHVAGIIAAVGNNYKGIIGVAPKAKIIPLKGLNDSGFGTTSDLSSAITYASQNGAKVINNSWGCGYCPSNPVAEDAVRFAINNNSVVVFSAGNNNGQISNSSPQNMINPKPVVVGSSDHLDQKSVYSNYGSLLDVLAPGGESESSCSDSLSLSILSLRAAGTNIYNGAGCGQDWINSIILGNNYIRARGTSMASPYAAGVAALIRATRPNFSVEDVRLVLGASADDIGNPDFDVYTGSGRINAYKALLIDSVPKLKITSPAFDASLDPKKTPIATITGTATGPNFKQYQVFGKARFSDTWTPLGSSSTIPIENGTLWSGSIADIPTDIYLVKLEVTSLNGFKFRYMTEVAIEPYSIQITTNNFDQQEPAISGNRIVWTDARNSTGTSNNSDIYLYDLSTNAEKAVTTANGNQMMPAISGNNIVWEDWRSGLPDIYLYDLSANMERTITTAINAQQKPAITGNRIVWEDRRNRNADIYLYDLSTNTERAITTNPSDQKNPAIDGNYIVWEDYRNGGPQIYLYDLSTNTERQITTNPSAHLYPSVSGNKIVWEDWRTGSAPVVFLYDLSTNTEKRIINNTKYQFRPKISGNKIVWQDSRNDESAIYLYDLSTNTEIPISIRPSSKYTPAIDGDKVVWGDYRNGNYDIYAYNPPGSIIPTSVPKPSPIPSSIPTPVNGIGFENLYPPSNILINNPVKFSGTIVDNLNTIGYRFYYVYIDDSNVTTTPSYYAHLSSSTVRVPVSYSPASNFATGTHSWFIRVKDLTGKLLADSSKNYFSIGYGISTPTPTKPFYPSPIYASPTPTNSPTPTPTPSLNSNTVTIRVYQDTNNNGQKDYGEGYAGAGLIIYTPGYINPKTNSSGEYVVQNAKTGIYTVLLYPIPAGYTVVGQSFIQQSINQLPAIIDFKIKK